MQIQAVSFTWNTHIMIFNYCREKDIDIPFAQDAIDEYKVAIEFCSFCSCTLFSTIRHWW